MTDFDRAANDAFRNAGYADQLLHRAGHGIGVTGHEGPFFAEGYEKELHENMVFTVEPGADSRYKGVFSVALYAT